MLTPLQQANKDIFIEEVKGWTMLIVLLSIYAIPVFVCGYLLGLAAQLW